MKRRMRLVIAAVVLAAGLVVIGSAGPAEACRPSSRHGAHACGSIVRHAHHHHRHHGGSEWMPWWMFVRFTGGPR